MDAFIVERFACMNTTERQDDQIQNFWSQAQAVTRIQQDPAAYLLKLPTELLLDIVDHLLTLDRAFPASAIPDIRNLSLVCRRMREISQPYIFREIKLSPSFHERKGCFVFTDRAMQLNRTLYESPNLGLATKMLSVCFPRMDRQARTRIRPQSEVPLYESRGWQQLLKMTSCLPKVHNLHIIQKNNNYVPDLGWRFLETAAKLMPNIRHLTIHFGNIPGAQRCFRLLESLNQLRNLELYWANPLPIWSEAGLDPRQIHIKSLRKLSVRSKYILPHVDAQYPLVESGGFHQFLAVLPHCENLHTVSWTFQESIFISSPFKSTSIPSAPLPPLTKNLRILKITGFHGSIEMEQPFWNPPLFIISVNEIATLKELYIETWWFDRITSGRDLYEAFLSGGLRTLSWNPMGKLHLIRSWRLHCISATDLAILEDMVQYAMINETGFLRFDLHWAAMFGNCRYGVVKCICHERPLQQLASSQDRLIRMGVDARFTY